MPRFPVLRQATVSANSAGTTGAWLYIGDLSTVCFQLSPGASASVISCTYVIDGTIEQADSTPALNGFTAVTTPGYSRIFSAAVATTADLSAVGLASCPAALGGANTTLETFPIRFIRVKLTTLSQGTPHLKVFGYTKTENS